MNDDVRLKEMLRRADGGGDSCADASVVAGAVVRKGRRRAVVRRVGGVVAALVVASGVAAYSVRDRGEGRVVVVREAVSGRAEIERLDGEMRLYLAMAARADAAGRVSRATAAMAGSRLGVSVEQERAATTLLTQADWRRARGESAEAEYRRVVELFGETRAAGRARERLGSG